MCFNIFFKNRQFESSFVSQPSESPKNSIKNNHKENCCNICKIKKYLVKMKCNHTICIKCISKTNYYDNDKCILCIK
jgi:hypothetical protein